MKVGIAGEQPFSYIDKDGELTGASPAIARIIFGRLGIDNVQPMPTEFASLIPGLNSQQFDVVAAGMYITPERCAQVLFADPEYEMRDAFIVRKGNPKGLHTYKDIAEKGAEARHRRRPTRRSTTRRTPASRRARSSSCRTSWQA